MSFEEARRLRAVLRKKPVAFQFGTQQRSDLKFRWACELARNGRVGKLREIHVSVPAGGVRPAFPEQAVPADIDWDRWVGPAPMTPFHEEKLNRAHHENIRNFSLGMISCWGIHHLDIAQWGNDTDHTGPTSVEGSGEFPPAGGGYDAIWRWKVRFEYERAAPIVFVSDGTPDFQHGVRFIGESGWVHVLRGEIHASDPELLRNPQNKCGTMPIKLPVSLDHRRDFLDAIRHSRPTICGIESSVRGDALCHLALISIHQGRKLKWDPQAETFPDDEGARAMLAPRPFRGDWKLQDV
jgi:predicted dehydrogenase